MKKKMTRKAELHSAFSALFYKYKVLIAWEVFNLCRTDKEGRVHSYDRKLFNDFIHENDIGSGLVMNVEKEITIPERLRIYDKLIYVYHLPASVIKTMERKEKIDNILKNVA